MIKTFFTKVINKILFHLKALQKVLSYFFYKIKSYIKFKSSKKKITKINLCSGPILLPNYLNIDKYTGADLVWDLGKNFPPIKNGSVDVLICISSINYFTRTRGKEIIKDVYRVLKPGGIARFATQDLKLISEKYINNDKTFFFQKLPNGNERFKGKTMCDKINSWFYGYRTPGGTGKYFYDYETLALLFKEAGFSLIENKNFKESRIKEIDIIDNRQDQMFFLEAIK